MLKLINDDCLVALKSLSSNSIDSIVTDPPAGIAFMGKDWDKDKGGRDGWIAWLKEVMVECKRVLKPGGHALVWAIPRTSHWTATGVEDAGFEIRDIIVHIFGSGFPKSQNISKAIDKAAGVERELIRRTNFDGSPVGHHDSSKKGWKNSSDNNLTLSDKPITPEAKTWDGFGTALKPSNEHWILARKPLSEKTVAKNVLKHGTGGINIDESRIATSEADCKKTNRLNHKGDFEWGHNINTAFKMGQGADITQGRFPANTIVDESAVDDLDGQSGVSKSTGGSGEATQKSTLKFGGEYCKGYKPLARANQGGLGDSGGASRFFYCPKASKKDKEKGLDSLDEKISGLGDDRPSGQSMQRLDGRADRKVKNTHPTVKNTQLMSYLIKLITPPGGVVLDPFMGSGSTGVSAVREGFGFVGIEREKEYFKIASTRVYDEVGIF